MSDIERGQLAEGERVQGERIENRHAGNNQAMVGAPGPPPGAMVELRRRTADPGALGLFAFASTLLIWSLYNLQTRRVTHPNFIVGMAIFCGGLAMILAGMWAFPRGDAFCGTMFVMYGAFWLSYAAILIPGTGILAAYVLEWEFRNALGIYLVVWAIVTFWLFFPSCQRNWVYPIFLGFLMVTFWLLAIGAFIASIGTIKAGGVFGCITAFIGYGCGLILLLSAGSHFDTEKPEYYWVPLGSPIFK